MKAGYMSLFLAFVCPVLADDPKQPDCPLDISQIVQEVTAAAAISADRHDLVTALRNRTYGKQIVLTEATVIGLNETDSFSVSQARPFAGLYSLEGSSQPEPSTLDAKRIAETLRGVMAHADCRADLETIRCSGAGLVILSHRENAMTCSYNLLASRFNLRRLRLGQLVSLEVTISGLRFEKGHLQIFGVLKQIQTR